jgi:hypothetical protein
MFFDQVFSAVEKTVKSPASPTGPMQQHKEVGPPKWYICFLKSTLFLFSAGPHLQPLVFSSFLLGHGGG